MQVAQARHHMSLLVHTETETTRPSLGLLTRDELAAELKCSPRHVMRLTAKRVIPKITISSRCVRYNRASVLAALTRREQEACVA